MVNLRGDTAAQETASYDLAGSDSPLVWKEEGNKAFELNDHVAALEMYRRGIEVCTLHDTDLLGQLHANRALCLVKLRRFDEAVEHCDFVLDRLRDSNAKVLYRRALSRHGQATTKNCGAHKRVLLELARIDLLRARHQLLMTQEPSSAAMLSAVKKALLQSALLIGDPYVRHVEETLPSPDEQRSSVVRLLRSRRGVERNAAFFLIDWTWWCSWCHFVHLEPDSEIIQLLPAGVRFPDEISGSDSVPGPIDNSSLILSQRSHIAQWYAQYDGKPILRPNLVRGYHFEVLPREVYFALKIWFGEVTISICRRAGSGSKIQLYPLCKPQQPQPMPRCGACRSTLTKGRCTGCNTRYCNSSCRNSHWPYHRQLCGGEARQERHPVGVNNLGNTCFVNAALQVLSHTAPLTRYVLSSQYLSDLNKSNQLRTRGKLAAAFRVVFRELWMSSAIRISPMTFTRSVAMCTPRFAGYLQHDAQEFLAYLLDGLHEDLRSKVKPQIIKPPNSGTNAKMPIEGAHAWDKCSADNDSIVFRTFYGMFRSTCVCPDCGMISSSFEVFNHVPLQIPVQDNPNGRTSELHVPRITLERCLDDFLKPERLDEQNLWYCSRCQNHVRATKTMQLWRLPNVLVIQLKRFEYKSAVRRDKIHSFVEFPTECLDLHYCLPAIEDERQVCDSSVPPVYDLFGVINHYGRIGFGHYTAIARTWDESSISPVWTLFDDSHTRHIGESGDLSQPVVSPAAYVLLYRRRVFH